MDYNLLCLIAGIVVILFISLLLDLRAYVTSGFEAHPHHYLYSGLFFVAAHLAHRAGDTPLDYGFIFLGFLSAGWIAVISYKQTGITSREADTKYLTTYHRLSPEERAELGYMPSKDSIRIEMVRHNTVTGAYEGESHDWIPVSPAKFRLWTQAILEQAESGEFNLTFAKWAGKGHLFTDPEYERLIAKLLEPDIKHIVFKNGKTSDNGFLPTEDGLSFFRDFLGEAQIKEEAENILHNRLHAEPEK